jgi:opacity protein-like surface antigen
MRRLILGLLLLVLVSIPGMAQASDEPKGQGYVFFAPGTTSPGTPTGTVHFGVGGEALVYKGLGLGGEVGYLAPWSSVGDGMGTFSPDLSYHFRSRSGEQKLVPFVTGGYTLFFRSGTANGFNFGGGVNYWFREHLGLRLEFRDNVWTTYATGHFLGFRVGLAFR